MSNAWRDDGFFGQPWVRAAGALGAAIYQAAEDYCHRELSGALVPLTVLRHLVPWPTKPGELDAAIDLLERLGRFEVVVEADNPEDGGAVFLPHYALEQEPDESRRDRRASAIRAGRARAATAQRDASGRLAGTSAPLAERRSPPASGPIRSGPVRSDPPETMPPAGTGPAAPPRLADPPPAPPPDPGPSALPAVVDDEPEAALPAVRPPKPGTLAAMRETGAELVAALLTRIATTPPRDDVDQVWRYHTLRCAIATGSKPTWKQHFAMAIHGLLRQHPVAELVRRLDNWHERPPYALRDKSPDFGTWLAVFDQCSKRATEAIVRQIQFEQAGQAWLEANHGVAEALSPELRTLIAGPRQEMAF
jgi:hypothetical protein